MSSRERCYEITGDVKAVWANIESPSGCPRKEIVFRMGLKVVDIEAVIRQALNRAGNNEVAKHYGKGMRKQVFVVKNKNDEEVYIHYLYMSEKQRDEADQKLRRQIASLQASGKKISPEYYERLLLLQNYLLFVERSEKEGTTDN
jgi:hypothetical protein